MALNNKEASLFWDDASGPFENLLHIAEMGSMFVAPGIVNIVIFLSEAFDMGPQKIGRSIDEALGLKNVDDLANADFADGLEKVVEFFSDSQEVIDARANLTIPLSLKKNAGKVGLFKRLFHLLKWGFLWAKRIAVGGLSVLALEAVSDRDSDTTPSKGKVRENSSSNPFEVDLSTKKTDTRYRKNLEGRIEKILAG